MIIVLQYKNLKGKIMKKIVTLSGMILLGLTFTSCSNMVVGFEEDSPLYNGYIIDTREDVVTKDNKPKTVKQVIKKVKNVKVIQEIKELQKKSTKDKLIIKNENETTFYYEIDDE